MRFKHFICASTKEKSHSVIAAFPFVVGKGTQANRAMGTIRRDQHHRVETLRDRGGCTGVTARVVRAGASSKIAVRGLEVVLSKSFHLICTYVLCIILRAR